MARSGKMFALSNIVRLREANRTTSKQPHRFLTRSAAAHLAPPPDHPDELARAQTGSPAQLPPNPSRLGGSSQTNNNTKNHKKAATDPLWLPHPRNGIYFPEGYEWVMDDVPETAASLGQTQTYWLRNDDGVEKHDPDIPSPDHYLLFGHHHV